MSVVDPQNSELVSVQEPQLDAPHGESDLDAITSGQSEAGDPATDTASLNGKSTLTDASGSQETSTTNADGKPAKDSATAKPTSKVSAAPKKPGTMASNTPSKANGVSGASAVKKVLNSGTFGVGSVKPAPAVKSAASGGASGAKTAAAAPPLRKTSSSTTPTGAASKTTSAPSRRASIVSQRTNAPVATRNPLSASVNSKPSATEVAKTRASVASPTGSVTKAPVTRPRASVTEAVRKTVTKTPAPTTRTTTATRPAVTRTATKPPASSSIGSIKELKENPKVVEELRGQLKEAEDSLKTKEEAVAGLEEQLAQLQTRLQTALDDAEAKGILTADLEKAKAELELQLLKPQESAGQFEGSQGEHEQALQGLRDELEAAKKVGSEQVTEVERLEGLITSLEAAVLSAKTELESVQSGHAAALESATQASSVERDALLKAQADVETITAEAEALKVAHADALEKASSNVAELGAKTAQLASLQEQLDTFKAEREETAGKVSELEVEILELKEQIEELEEGRLGLQTTVKTLEGEVEKATKALQEFTQQAGEKEVALNTQIEALQAKNEQDVKDAESRYQALQATLTSLQEQLGGALGAQEKASQDIVAAQNAHDEQVKQLEASHAAREMNLSSQIASISEMLQKQEAIYDAKVQVVKDEHQTLLQEAFERAKSEAANDHAQELQSLRNESNATIKEIQESNKVTQDSLKNDHASLLDATVNDYTKKINNLNLELKATKDDLAKSKSVVESVKAELEAVTKQRDEARTAANAPPVIPQQHVDEVARLSQELSNTKDDLGAVTEMLNLTKHTLQDMSEKHQKDLEEVAQNKATEIIKINSAHDEEVTSLVKQKSELLTRLSDLEGELSTLKADLAAARTASPKTNGPSHPVPGPPDSSEQLAQLHGAHTLKIYDLQAKHDKELKALKEELEVALEKAESLNEDVARKAMEIQYLEQEQDENQETIRQLTEDLEAAKSKETAPVVA